MPGLRLPSLISGRALGRAVRYASAGATGYGKGPYRGFVPPKVPEWQKKTGELIATSAWLWFFWRIKLDGGHLLGIHDFGDHGDDHH
mmetsp:Transcript_21948/g.66705  ORF Transcript_21948/g.66705 Transcript_21948/m.66705 type:complete len:87 (-) Transcript_21948:748-1008(-)